MVYLVYFIYGFAVLQFLVALSNYIFQPSLPLPDGPFREKVSILIPARNEEHNIGVLLDDLLLLDGLQLEIIVFNDQSTDRTAEVVTKFVRKDPRVRLLESDGLPAGWLGKNYACHCLSQQASGQYFLFLDADVRVGKSIIQKTLLYAQAHHLALVSIFPKQLMLSFGEWITVPNMNFILLSQLPLFLVRTSSYPSLAAANGQFMFFDAAAYREREPHAAKKNSKVEDIEIIRWYKEGHLKVACLLGDDMISCRMYRGFREAVDGFAKNVCMFFCNSFLLAILFFLLTSFGFILVYCYSGLFVFFVYLLLVLSTRFLISVLSKQNSLFNLLLLPLQQFSIAAFIFQALKNKINKKQVWKERNI